jgi:hypothetical protein
VIVEDFCKGSALTFTSWSAILTGVKEVVIYAVVHCPATEEETDDEVKIGFEQMDYSELIQFQNAWFLVDHHIKNRAPSVQVKTVKAGERGEGVDDFENMGGRILDRDVIVRHREISVKVAV